MMRGIRYVLVGLLVVSAVHTADTTGCVIRKGSYEAWLSLAKRSPRNLPKVGALLSSSRSSVDPASAQEISREYQMFFQCLSDAKVPADDDGGRSMCTEAAVDGLGSLVCQAALYLKTNRATATDLLEAVPASKKGAEMIWDLEAIGDAGDADKRFPPLFAPDGPAHKLVNEVFVMALDDRETAMSKYFHIVGAAPGSSNPYIDSQLKILMRESPVLVVKHWEILRQYQARLKNLLNELYGELSPADLNKVRQGIASSCSKDNLDCPEIQRFFGRPR